MGLPKLETRETCRGACEHCRGPLFHETRRGERISTGFGMHNKHMVYFCTVECRASHYGRDVVIETSEQTKLDEWGGGMRRAWREGAWRRRIHERALDELEQHRERDRERERVKVRA